MKYAIAWLLLCFAITSVCAQESPQKLDLTLPAINDASSNTPAATAPTDLSGNNAVDASDSQPDPNSIDPTKSVAGLVQKQMG
ncbi:MAG: hypothetical protein ABI451_07925, partial [Dokdonella sp.]